MRIVCIGDSITAGQHVPPGSGWVELLGLVNHGVPGDTSRLGLERFPTDVQQAECDLVIIQFGHNDANRWQTDQGLPRVSLDGYQANLAEMIERARRFQSEPLLVGLTRPGRNHGYVEDCQRYDQAAKQVSERLGTNWCDLWNVLPAERTPDGLHPDPAGHLLYANSIAAALCQN